MFKNLLAAVVIDSFSNCAIARCWFLTPFFSDGVFSGNPYPIFSFWAPEVLNFLQT